MKKTSMVFMFVVLLIALLITRVSAIDMNLINSIRQNEINEAENLSTTNSTRNPLANNAVPNTVLNNTITNTNTNIPSANDNTVTRNSKWGFRNWRYN